MIGLTFGDELLGVMTSKYHAVWVVGHSLPRPREARIPDARGLDEC
jgi:hypothetical protein